VRVSAADTLAVNYCNMTASAIVPTTETYVIGNFQAEGARRRQRGVPVGGAVAHGDQHARERGALGARDGRPHRRTVEKQEEDSARSPALAGDGGGLS
jgi:hypothetical protein